LGLGASLARLGGPAAGQKMSTDPIIIIINDLLIAFCF
jgi:hypothetical protein